MTEYNLERFLLAQEKNYKNAFVELSNGKKTSHWMWYVFPQIQGLGVSSTAQFYAIKDIGEAEAYLKHPVLGIRLIKVTEALLQIEGKTAFEIFGLPDDMKLKSCMTLFNLLDETNTVFERVLNKYFQGERDRRTIEILSNN